MRVRVIADVHGNPVALETVLADLGREPADRLVCLGDVAARGLQPSRAAARLRGLGCPSVVGDTDAWLLDGPSSNPANDVGAARAEIARWGAAKLSDEDRDYRRRAPAQPGQRRPTAGVGPGTSDPRIDHRASWAGHAVLETGSELFRVDFRRVPVDTKRNLEAVRASGMPHLGWWVGLWGNGAAEVWSDACGTPGTSRPASGL